MISLVNKILQFQIHILPGSERIVEYNLYPLIPGSVSLPKLLLSIPDSSTEGPALRQDHLVSLLERALPKYLYVMVTRYLRFNSKLLLTLFNFSHK